MGDFVMEITMTITKKKYLIPAFILFFLLIRYVPEIGRDKSPADRFLVAGIIDGDTIELSGGDKLRLLGIDSPERGDPLYDSATAILTSLALNKTVRVTYSKRRRDGYGRILGYLFIDTVCINEAVLKSGMANVYLFNDNLGDSIRIRRLLNAQKEAMANKRGIWSRPVFEEPFYLVIKGQLRFHRPDCGSVKNKSKSDIIRISSRFDAFNEGYSPCRNCRP